MSADLPCRSSSSTSRVSALCCVMHVHKASAHRLSGRNDTAHVLLPQHISAKWRPSSADVQALRPTCRREASPSQA